MAAPSGGCADAPLYTLVDGRLRVEGDTSAFADDLTAADCRATAGSGLDGPQVYYRFDATANTTYRVSLIGDTAQYLHPYVVRAGCDVAAISAACSSGGASGVFAEGSFAQGETITLEYTAKEDGSLLIGVDSAESFNHGGFTLQVEAI